MANIKITNYKIKNNVNKKIVLLSDIHYYHRNDLKKLERIYNKIKDLDPNYICITGDFIDEAKVLDEDLFVFFLKKLSKVAKVIISLGNHDLIIRGKTKTYYYNDNMFNKIKQIRNVYLLDNDIKVIDDICFIGINLGFEYYYRNDENYIQFIETYHKIKKINDKKYNILLCHTPLSLSHNEVIQTLKHVDLVLCGHTHGGLTPTIIQKYMKNRILISPNKSKILINDGYGYVKKDKLDIIISSGITKLSHSSKINNLDFLFKPEIVLIELKKENS